MSICCAAPRREHADPLPALEVVADQVLWDWHRRSAVRDVHSFVAGFSHVSIWAARLLMDCCSTGYDSRAPEETLVGILRDAPPTMRTCSLGAASVAESAARPWKLKMTSVYESDADPEEWSCNPYEPVRTRRDHITTVYHSAANLAEELRPPADCKPIAKRIAARRAESGSAAHAHGGCMRNVRLRVIVRDRRCSFETSVTHRFSSLACQSCSKTSRSRSKSDARVRCAVWESKGRIRAFMCPRCDARQHA